MKKIILFFVLLFSAMALFAQITSPPTNLVDVVTHFNEYMGTLLGLSFLSVWLTGILNGWLKVSQKGLRQLVSWLVPIVIALIFGTLLNFGFLGSEKWYIAVLYGFGAGLVSNGIFDISFVEVAVKFIESKIKGE